MERAAINQNEGYILSFIMAFKKSPGSTTTDQLSPRREAQVDSSGGLVQRLTLGEEKKNMISCKVDTTRVLTEGEEAGAPAGGGTAGAERSVNTGNGFMKTEVKSLRTETKTGKYNNLSLE